MLDKAKAKLRSEMDQNKNNSYVQVVGNFLLQHVESNPGAAEKIMTSDKTIAKSLDEMRKAAEKKQVNHCGMFTPDEGFEIIMKYFGITGSAPAPAKVEAAAGNYRPQPPAPSPAAKPAVDFDINLDDLL